MLWSERGSGGMDGGMARFARYEDALALTERVDLLDATVLMRALDVGEAAAAAFLRRLQEDGVIEPLDGRPGYRVRRGRRRSWSEVRAEAHAAPPPGGQGESERLQALARRVQELEFELAGWRRRALEAESALARATPRIDLLRRRLAKLLHPDGAGGDLAQLSAREELFKSLWPRIEAALRDAEGPEEDAADGA